MTVATRIDTAALDHHAAVLTEIAAGSAERERAGQDPREQVHLLRSAGLTALTLDAEHGGGGAGPVELLEFVIDLARADPIAAHILRAHFWFVEQILRLPDGPIRDRWSAEVVAGRIVGNASSERTGIAGELTGTARLVPVATGWVLTGEKFYSTGTAFADYVATQAIIDDGGDRIARVIVPVDRLGVTVIDDWDGIGQHRTGTGSTTFDGVAVSDDDILTIIDPSSDVPVANDAPLLQLFLQALITGILFSVADDAAELLRSRTRSFAHAPDPLPRHDPLLLATVGEIESAAHVARAAVLAAGVDIAAAMFAARRGRVEPELFAAAALSAARVKVHVDRIALPAASSLFDAGGASSASRARNLDRHWRNIRTITLHNPTSYKAVAVGDLRVNGTPLPHNGYF